MNKGVVASVGSLPAEAGVDGALVVLKTSSGSFGLVASIPCADRDEIVREFASINGAVCGIAIWPHSTTTMRQRSKSNRLREMRPPSCWTQARQPMVLRRNRRPLIWSKP